MRIEHLQFLVEVAKYKSISTAAKKLYISQTGLSTIVNSLEQELNIQIFKRTNKGIQLTEDGAQAIELIKDILQKNDELHYLFSSSSTQSQIINLGVFPAGTKALSHHLMKNWAAKPTRAHLHIYQVGYEDTKTFIQNHTANIVVSATLPDDPFPAFASSSGNLCLEQLYTDHFSLFVSSGSDLASKSHVTLEEVIDRHLLLTHTYPGTQDKIVGQLLHKFPFFTVLPNLDIAKSVLLEHPDTIMIAPTITARPVLQSGQPELTLIDIVDFEAELDVFMIYDISSKLSISETLLMQEIRSFFSSIK